MAKKQQRYFYRNTGAAHKTEAAGIPASNPVEMKSPSEPVSVQLPHISLTIPALNYQNFLFSLYSFVAFFSILLLIFTWMKPPAISSLPAYNLIHKPASAHSHLQYMEWLVSHYRLVDAEREILYVRRAQSRGWYADLDTPRFNALQSEAARKQEFFRSLVAEYAYWHRTNREYPHYRDGLYRASQLSYMLLNDVESNVLLQKSYSLDPQFTHATQVQSQLGKK